MQAENTIVTEFQSSVDFAVKRYWITKNQAELIRLADTIETIAYQILDLERFMNSTKARDACWNYWLQTCFRNSPPEIIFMVKEEVDKILIEQK
jgi:hypothetical protein